MDYNRILQGMIRAARLDKNFYEEVEHDTSYTQDALAVVILASLAGALGSFLSGLFGGHFGLAIFSFVVGAVTGVVSYYIWVYLVHWIGTKFFKGTGDRGEVARALGFAWGPRVLNILSFIPILGGLVGFVAWIWTIATGFVATRQSLDQDDTNAALTVIAAAIVAFVISVVIGIIFGVIGAAIGLAGAAVTGALGQ